MRSMVEGARSWPRSLEFWTSDSGDPGAEGGGCSRPLHRCAVPLPRLRGRIVFRYGRPTSWSTEPVVTG